MTCLKISKFQLSVIVPVRLIDDRMDILERLSFCKMSYQGTHIEFIVIDDGSDDDKAELLRSMCLDLELNYYSTGAESSSAFNLARARNFGARVAKAELIMFMDVDLIPYPGFYDDLLIEAELLDMRNTVDHLLMCPVIYLTDEGYRLYNKTEQRMRKSFCINQMIESNKDYVSKYSHGTSVVLVNRYFYLSCGGQNETFEGWGYEDYEFTTRLIRKNMRYPLPRKWNSMKGNFMNIRKYRGWKSIYRLYGDWLGSKGIYLIHAPHDIDGEYHQNKKRNEKILKAQLERDVNILEPRPLSIKDEIVTAVHQRNRYSDSRYLHSFFGQCIDYQYEKFDSDSAIVNWLEKHNIKQCLFELPLLDENSKALYQWCLNKHFNYICCGKGALPNSVFFERNNSVNLQKSLPEESWNHPLSVDEILQVSKYVEHKEGKRKQKLAKLSSKLFENINKKVLLVSLCDEYCPLTKEQIADVILLLSQGLGSDWLIVYPRAKQLNIEITGRVWAINDADLFEAEELADSIIALNANSAIHGIICNKPVYLLGKTWFSHPLLNVTVNSNQQLVEAIKKGFRPSTTQMMRLVYFLRFKFYSFTQYPLNDVEMSGDNPSSPDKFIEIRGLSDTAIHFNRGRDVIPFSSPQFDRYWSDNYQKLNYLKKIASHKNIKAFVSKLFKKIA
ncbi:glycosyltransferase [Thalassotalea sp. HSM 43]|uniref:glycosyltransferase n=1 Tax=Thalassotalea sp. HSM 43 TaxID=2552945 RepID=UPI0010817023|nr:glycosyltransferase [Thalassotalea sp. HSM 43]QBY03537.1 glycosyltransferase [Thalassotalea sp. HSM 43]